jgi:hypothetical protein
LHAYHRALVIAGKTSIEHDIHAALEAYGIDASIVPVEAADDALSGFDDGRDFVVDRNNRICAPGFRKLSLMADHPCAHRRELEDHFTGREILGWSDPTHVAAMTALGLPHPSIFLPDAGPDPQPASSPLRDRDIDILVVGAPTVPIERSRWVTAHADWPEMLSHIVFDTAELLPTAAEPVIDLFRRVCAAYDVTPSDRFGREAMCIVVTSALRLAEANRHARVLGALPDVRIALLADAVPAALRDRSSVTCLGRRPRGDKLDELIRRSKILLDAGGSFPQGPLQTVWAGMAARSVVLTGRSDFLGAEFADGRDILFLPSSDLAGGELDELRSMVERPAQLQRIADSAATRYAARHTWKQRIEIVCRTIGGIGARSEEMKLAGAA